MEDVFFKPWIGPKYEGANPKILIMGDSHYCYIDDEDGNAIPAVCSKCGVRGYSSLDEMKTDPARHPDCPNFTTDDKSFTQGIMDCFINALEKHAPSGYEVNFLRFSNKLLGINKNNPEYYDRSIDFWNHLAFYNFVQAASARNKSAKEYDDNDRRMSSPLADDVVEALQPDYVIVWGSQAFGYWEPAQGFVDMEGWMTFTLKSGKTVKAIRIDHPSRGFKKKDFELISSIIRKDYNTLYLMKL